MFLFNKNQLSILSQQLQNNKFKQEVYKKRYRNFFTLPLFIILMVGFLYSGYFFKEEFFSVVFWHIYMIFAYLFLVLGIFTWLNYAWLIIKFRKKDQ